MTTSALPIGLSICAGNWTLVHPTLHDGPKGPRKLSGHIEPGRTIHSTLKYDIVPRLGCNPGVIAIAHFEPIEEIDEICGDYSVVTVSPTVATLAGLGGYHDPHSKLLQAGPVNSPSAIGKIGPERVSFAKDGDTVPHYLEPSDLGQLSDEMANFVEFVTANCSTGNGSIEILGTTGFTNAAKYLLEQGGPDLPEPTPLTRDLLRRAEDRHGDRVFAWHIFSMASHRDQFSATVAAFMTRRFGEFLACVASETRPGRLYMQWNPAAHIKEASSLMLKYGLPDYLPDGLHTDLIGFLPSIPEAIGASRIAQLQISNAAAARREIIAARTLVGAARS